MEKIGKLWTSPMLTWIFGGLGDVLLVVGIVTAVMDITVFAGFSPIFWFLLAICSYLSWIGTIALRTLVRLESRARS